LPPFAAKLGKLQVVLEINHQTMKKIVLLLAALIVLQVAMPVQAGSKRAKAKQIELTLFKYASAIRWNEFEMALNYVDPDYKEKSPLSDLEKERLKQIQVTGYEPKTQDTLPDGTIEQTVEIRLINRNTQTDRSVLDVQIWRWDEKAKRWWLTTGLPDFTAKSY
jgi:hypothetical protein